MIEIVLARPWLSVDLGPGRRVLSSAPWLGGLVAARRIVWREVRDADLGEDFDAPAWLGRELASRGWGEAVGMLTSRRLDAMRRAEAAEGRVRAVAVATVGLGNAARIGATGARAQRRFWGTINLAVVLDAALSEAALVEAVSLAASARTAAVLDAGIGTAEGPATGTGTDCLAVAAPAGDVPWCGLHTEAGRALGRAAYEAVAAGAADWKREFGDAALSA